MTEQDNMFLKDIRDDIKELKEIAKEKAKDDNQRDKDIAVNNTHTEHNRKSIDKLWKVIGAVAFVGGSGVVSLFIMLLGG